MMSKIKITFLIILIIIISISLKAKYFNQHASNMATSTTKNLTLSNGSDTLANSSSGFTIDMTRISTLATDTEKLPGNLICQASFPIFIHYENKNNSVYFYEDSAKTYLFSQKPDGSKEYSLSEKVNLNKTAYYNIDPENNCAGDISESVDPRQETVYSPFSCSGDGELYGFCPTPNLFYSILTWHNGNKNQLSNQTGRAYGKYLIPGDNQTLLNEIYYYLVSTNEKTISELVLPYPDESSRTYIYPLTEQDTPESIAKSFGLSLKEIYDLNPKLNEN